MSVSDEILRRTADSYRRMRNTVRFLLGNLHGFDPKKDAVNPAEMIALDRWALARTSELQSEIVDAYKKYAFHLIYQKVHNYCIVDLGGFYLDILKDRLYTTPAKSHARRSAQTAMYHIAESMVRWLAPILSFTAEEIWRYLPGERGESVFLSTWHQVPEVPAATIDWAAMIALRSDVQRQLEKLRDAGTIGAPLDAEVDIYAEPQEFERFGALKEELRFMLITSAARVHKAGVVPEGAVQAPSAPSVWIVVKPTQDVKCVRCWNRRPDVGSSSEHPELCERCVTNLAVGETRRYA
jgi:isoleucyl-tRNA synthetase